MLLPTITNAMSAGPVGGIGRRSPNHRCARWNATEGVLGCAAHHWLPDESSRLSFGSIRTIEEECR